MFEFRIPRRRSVGIATVILGILVGAVGHCCFVGLKGSAPAVPLSWKVQWKSIHG